MFAAFEANSTIVIDFLFIEDYGAAKSIITHDIGGKVQKVDIILSHYNPKIVRSAIPVVEIGLSIFKRNDGAGIRTLG